MFEVSIEVEEKRVAELLSTGYVGIKYWCYTKLCTPGDIELPDWCSDFAREEVWPLYDGWVTLELHHPHEKKDRYVLSAIDISDGLKLMAQKYPKHWAQFLLGNEDSITGDIFIQLCLFGELVYG
jgi:hypothetical protein